MSHCHIILDLYGNLDFQHRVLAETKRLSIASDYVFQVDVDDLSVSRPVFSTPPHW